ncbi:precursor of CEP5-like [Vigna umbellata]|uniref:precursor of CEP5-like n=1 Tax=Vigna umbellata TaxID=87088 RepID=UPI001F5FB8B5|nr:precursor of CEP5-like [Vigna umbellata]
MANLKHVFMITCVLLCLVYLNGIASAEARALKKEHVMGMAAVEDNINLLWRRRMIENVAIATKATLDSPNNAGRDDKWIDDFRPTDPGHSPGAGHSSPTPKQASNNGATRP